MSEQVQEQVREGDEAPHPKALERKQKAHEERIKSIRYLVVSILLALVGTYKLTLGGVDGTSEMLWVGVMLLAGGFATMADFKRIVGQ